MQFFAEFAHCLWWLWYF